MRSCCIIVSTVGGPDWIEAWFLWPVFLQCYGLRLQPIFTVVEVCALWLLWFILMFVLLEVIAMFKFWTLCVLEPILEGLGSDTVYTSFYNLVAVCCIW